MDLSHRNGNHNRKLSQSIEHEDDLKRENEQSVGCFSRCCKRKKHKILLDQNNKRKKISMEKTPMPHLSRSPIFNETAFCEKLALVNDDPCLQCDVQYGPDAWENAPKCSPKRLPSDHQVSF